MNSSWRTETIEDIENNQGNAYQETAKKAFLDVVKKGCPIGENKDYLFSQAMLVAFVAGRAFEANRL